MDHPVLSQREVLQQMPAWLGDMPARPDETAHFSYRSEAFAEDLDEADAPTAPPPRGLVTRLLVAAPVGTAIAGGLLAFLSR